jgi:hypothetical protein
MAGDPKVCLAFAAHCTAAATAEIEDQEWKCRLLDLAAKWTSLAVALETTQEIILRFAT